MSKKPYVPTKKTLEKYADTLVNFALNSGKGIKKGEVVRIVCSESAKPLLAELQKAVLDKGGYPLLKYVPEDTPVGDHDINLSKDYYEHASKKQLEFFPEKYMKSMVETIDHQILIVAEGNKHALSDVDPKNIMTKSVAMKPLRQWLDAKENKGEFTWTIALYGTPAMANEAGLSEKEYWNQIIKACYLDKKDPVAEWKSMYKELEKYRKRLNKITEKTEWFHVTGENADLWIKAGDRRAWMGGSGRNIPSFELFTSPDWRGTEGWIRFNEPLYAYGTIVKGIELWFEKGKVVKSKATKNEKVLKAMLNTENADKVGEFSMTDKRFSRITKFMAETLYDENVGGKYGNTHIAVGKSYADCFAGDPAKMTKKQWEKLGYNDSVVHTDMMQTTDRTITAHLTDGTEKLLYKKGKYQF